MAKKTQRAGLDEEKRNKSLGERFLTIESIRAADGENQRRFIVSFSSEEPYKRWFGMEILDHSDGAVDLTRLNSVGVLLFNHDTYMVLGKVIKAWIDNKRGQAEVEFDSDEDADVIYQKVKSGTLKTTSVRYRVDETSWESIPAGKTSREGHVGPCEIARQWEPYEISIVSVPADATVGVGRDMDFDEPEQKTASMIGVYERQIAINKNFLGGN